MTERGQPVETAPVRRGPNRRPLLIGAALVALALVVVKPWGGSPGLPERRSQPSSAPARTPTPFVRSSVSLPAGAFKPSAGACCRDSGWHVCLLEEGGGQQIQSWFTGSRAASPEPPAPPAPALPAVLLVTRQNAGLGFYPPASDREQASGTIVVAAWRVDELTTGTRSLALEPLGPVGVGDAIAQNVFIPPLTQATAGRWPVGRYVFRFQGAAGVRWEQYFAIAVVAAEPPASACSVCASEPPVVAAPQPSSPVGG